jgi:glycosyltransferase involved in cell wall biosynthesis
LRILWLKTELLHPVDKGGRIRTYNMLRELKRDNHITYLALDDGSAGEKERTQAYEYCHELICVPHRTKPKFSFGFYLELVSNLVSSLPYFINKYESSAMRSAIDLLVQQNRFDVLVCDFLQPSVNIPEEVAIPLVLFQHNVEAMIWKRHYEVQANPIKKGYLYNQWMKSTKYEGEACRRFDIVVAVSEADENQIKEDYGVKKAVAIPTGVDLNYFRPESEIIRDPQNVVFTGSMDWLPNEDAMQYFIREVLPLIRAQAPDTTLTVVGRDPYPSLIELSKAVKGIEVTGRVEDVRPYIARASVFVVPIRIGGGTRLKIYEAMAMRTPVVSTTIGAEGLPLVNGQEVLLADEPGDFAAAVVSLLRDKSRAQELGTRSLRLVQECYGWATVAKVFADICNSAISSHNGREVVRKGK